MTIPGSIDAYFRANLGAPNKIAPAALSTSFANRPGFALGMANIIIAKEGEKAGFVADLVFGPRGEDAVFGSPLNILLNDAEGGSAQIVNQLYAYWNVSDAVTFTLGNFNTFPGYEVISPASNLNYSTSYMFSYGPFSHTGLKADFSLSGNVSAMVAVMNPTDMTEFNLDGSYTFGAQLGFKGVYLNFLYGDQDGKLDEDFAPPTSEPSAGNTFQVDLTGGWDLPGTVYLGVNATYNTTGAGEFFDGTSIQDADGAGIYGVAGYLQLAASDVFSIGTRVEYFSVFNNGLGIIGLDDEGDGNVIDVTLTGQYKVGDLTIIPGFRFDNASEDSFQDNDSLFTRNTTSLSSFILATVYSF